MTNPHLAFPYDRRHCYGSPVWVGAPALFADAIRTADRSPTQVGFLHLALWPISGLVVQPVVGFYSDRCVSRFGRRRPFIACGAFLVAIAVLLIRYAADIGVSTGDKSDAPKKPRTIAIFVVGLWILDVANNTLQGPCRAFLADLAGSDASIVRTGNTMFAFFMAVGNVLGYLSGSCTPLYRVLPFTKTDACDVFCANLKTSFFISIVLLLSITALALWYVPEYRFVPEAEDGGNPTGKQQITTALKQLSKPMWILLLVTCLNWLAWFPFLLFDTDRMGNQVYGRNVGDTLYTRGVRAGAIGLMLNSVLSGLVSLCIECLARWVGGVKRLWAGVNFLLAMRLAMTIVITHVAKSDRGYMISGPNSGVVGGTLTVFAVLGAPLAIAVSMLSGPWDSLFGVGNLLSFGAGAVAAATSAIFILAMLPSPPPDIVLTGGGMH